MTWEIIISLIVAVTGLIGAIWAIVKYYDGKKTAREDAEKAEAKKRREAQQKADEEKSEEESNNSTREKFRQMLREGKLEDREIDMVVQLEQWDPEKSYDCLGLESETMDILGIHVPISVVPVTPGRNISIIIEAAAMNNRQKKMGYNAARQLLHNLGMTDDIVPEEDELEIWHNF